MDTGKTMERFKAILLLCLFLCTTCFSLNVANANGVNTNALDNFFGKSAQEQDTLSKESSAFSLNSSSPFTAQTYFDEQNNQAIFTFEIKGQSYLYEHALKVHAPDSTSVGTMLLPPSSSHEDALGVSQVFFNTLTVKVPVSNANAGDILTLEYQGCDEQGICYPPEKLTLTLPQVVGSATTEKSPNNNAEKLTPDISDKQVTETTSTFDPISLFSADETTEQNIVKNLTENLFFGLLVCFVVGIGLTLTPCVLPMLPVFSAMLIGNQKQEQKGMGFIVRQNLSYGLGLSLTYMVLGLLFASLGASLHGILQNPIVTGIVALLLLVCALACTGLIQMKMPDSFTFKVQGLIAKLNTQSMSGSFGMGALSALISSPCTSAPLAGALLYVLQTGNLFTGALTFFTIGLGMAFPLFLVGIFGGKYLRKSVIVGEIFKRILAIVLLFTAYYLVIPLLGNLQDAALSFVIYIAVAYSLYSIVYFVKSTLLTGFTYVLISILSITPAYYIYQSKGETAKYVAYENFVIVDNLTALQEQLKASPNQPAFVVFTAKWCANCRIMEQTIYSQEPFKQATKEVKTIAVDITDTQSDKAQELINQYNILGVPMFITFDGNGQPLKSHLGIASEKFVLDSVLETK